MSNRSSRRTGRRLRRPAPPRMEMPDIFVGTFTAALAAAAAVIDELGRALVSYVLDVRGQVTGGWALTGDHHQIDDLVLLVLAGHQPAPGTGVLLVSAVMGSDVSTMHDEDELKWGSFRRIFAARGYHLWDWIKADGEAFRSLYLGTDGADAWPAPAVTSSE